MRIAYRNYIDSVSAGSIIASATDTGYEVSHIQDQRLSYPYRTTASTATITIDLSSLSEAEISTLAILGHNLSSSASVVFDFNNTDSWPGQYQETLTWNEGIILKFLTGYVDTDADYLISEAGAYMISEAGSFVITSSGYQYCQVQISDPTNTDGYIQIGRVWIGNYLTINPSSLLDFKVTKKRSDVVIYGKDRQKFAVPGVGWRRIELSFPRTESAMVDSIFAMYKEIANHKSVIFCNFDTIRSYKIVEPMYCSIDGEIGFKHISRMGFQYQINFEEDR